MKLIYSNERAAQMLVSLLKQHNIKKIVASPGATNITFVATAMHDPWFEIYSSVDERSAAYIACGLAEEAQVKELWLTHYSPSLTHPEEYMEEVRKIFPAAKAGKDRKSIELDFEKDES